jgi:hypothetical protein
MGEERKGERTWGEEKDPNPDGPMAKSVNTGVVFANSSLAGVFNFSAILHWPEFRRVGGEASISGYQQAG